MNWLGYFALLFSVLCIFLHRPWSLGFAIAGAICGLLSAAMRHWDLVKEASDSFVAKVAIAVVAAAAIFFSPWIANTVLSEITLLRPNAFPAAYSAFQYISVLLLWAILAYCALIAVALLNVRQIVQDAASKMKREWYVKTEVLASLGRVAGLLVLLFYLAPMFLRAANYDSEEMLSRVVVTTSFVENGGQSVWISSIDPQFPSGCKKLAEEAKLDLAKPYSCSARTIRCSNIDPDARIAFLDDKGNIVIAKDVDSSDILHELVPVRFDIAECKYDKRYDIQVKQKP
jgi:ABC-type multidrug transport system fused ATPase/permease subunit